MKRFFFVILFIGCALYGHAQQDHRHGDKPGPRDMNIEQFVSNLSTAQKTQIDVIMRKSTKNIESYRKQLHAVRDTIRTYMNKEGDHSKELFPLYEREGKLQAEIGKEYYRMKIEIDKVLTPQQRRELQDNLAKNRAQHRRNRSDAPGNGSRPPKDKEQH